MEYQKIINVLDNTKDQQSKFRTRNWVEINDESRGKYDNSNIKFKTSMIRSDLCDHSDASYSLAELYQLLEKEIMLLRKSKQKK